MSAESEMSDGDKWWNARVAAMESLFGKRVPEVGHAVIPFGIGSKFGGRADVVYFRNYVAGLLSITSELIGSDDQIRNDIGNYELAICTRADEPWAPDLISRLAHYTLGRDAGVLLCWGITGEELETCRSDRCEEVEKALRAAGAFPFTDLQRQSVPLPTHRKPQ